MFNPQQPRRVVISIRDPLAVQEAARVRRVLAQLMVGANVLGVLFCGMFPFDFTWRVVEHFDLTIDQLWTAGDGPENIIFFVPFGFAMGAMLWKSGRYLQFITALVLSAALSLVVEISQMHLGSRDPSLSDVLCNTMGGVIGFAVFCGIGEQVMRPLTLAAQFFRNLRDVRWLVVPAVLWMLLASALPIGARNVGRLTSWNRSYPLLIGNETDQQRGWKGTVATLWLADRAIFDDDLERVVAGADPVPIFKDTAVAAYKFEGDGPYLDSTGHCGPLRWTADQPAGLADHPADGPPDRSGVMALGRIGEPITWAWWLTSSRDSATAALDRMAAHQAFTLVTDLACSDLELTDREPRIISVSENWYDCNVQLVQDRDKLVVRVRSAATGRSGGAPEFVVPGVFEDTNLRRIVVTYYRGALLVACDHLDQRYAVEMSPESWLVWRIYPRPGWRFRLDSRGQSFCGLIYRGLAMLPLGVMLGMIASLIRKKGQLRLPLRIIFICTPLAAVVLEAVLLLVCHSPVHVLGPVVSMVAGLIGAAATGRTAMQRA